MIRYQARITRADLQASPTTLFVFGDNLKRAGFGGQAREMRGEPNAVGIPTKREPTMWSFAFFTDQELETFRAEAAEPFARLAAHLRAGGEVVWPADGIGTGLAQLAKRAPRIWQSLERARLRLEEIGRGTEHAGSDHEREPPAGFPQPAFRSDPYPCPATASATS